MDERPGELPSKEGEVIDMDAVKRLVQSTTKDWNIANARADGLTVEQIAQQLEFSMSTVRRSLKRSGRWYPQTGTTNAADLLANPPFETGKTYEPACGAGAFLTDAAKAAGKEAK